MEEALVKKAYLLGRFDTLCEAGLQFKSPEDRQAASVHFVKTGELKLEHLLEKVAQQLMGPPMPQGGGMPMGGMPPDAMGMGGEMQAPPTTQPGASPAPMPQEGGMLPPSQPAPSQGEVLLIGGQISNSDIKGFEKILNILKGLKMQYDEQQGMAENAGAQQPAGGAPPPMQ